MTEEEKKIKKWSNEQKVEALAKFIALRSGDPRKALLYGFMLDCLLDEIDKRERKIKKQQTELKKKDKIIEWIKDYVQQEIDFRTENIEDYTDDGRKENENIIEELKEEREHWKDILRIMNNEKTYMEF